MTTLQYYFKSFLMYWSAKWITIRHKLYRVIIPNQELSVLYEELYTLNYGGHLSLYFPHMLRVDMTRDLAHLQLSDLQRELDLHAERLIYREKECLYAERNGYFPCWNNPKKIVLLSSICIFSSYFYFAGASLIKMLK